MTVAQPREQPREIVPLRRDRDGGLRIGETRVTLDSVVSAFDSGATPEEICEDFPTLDLSDVYAVVTYLLRHREEVDRYIAERRKEAAEIRQIIEASPANRRLRERILSRRDR